MRSKVTIAIPTLNRAEYLRIALESALGQTYPNIEVVVSNNASPDHTAAILKAISDPRVRVLEQSCTISMMENWNKCLDAASGEYFLLLSDDDVLEPSAIEEMVEVFERNKRNGKNVGIAYCLGRIIDKYGKTVSVGEECSSSESAKKLILAFFESKRNLWPCAILYRTGDLAPGYDLKFPLGADAVQWIRTVAHYGTACCINKPLVSYRVHRNTTATTEFEIWRKENVALAEFAIDELRKQNLIGKDGEQKVRRAVRRLNVRITAGLINQNLKHNKLRALAEYRRNLETFCGPYGWFTLTRGLLSLILRPISGVQS